MKNKLIQNCVVVGITAFCVIAAALLLFFLFFNFRLIRELGANIVRILSPVITGAVIAYLLAPLYNWVVRNTDALLRARTKWKKTRTLATASGVIVSIGAAILVVSGLVALVVPQFISSVVGIVNSMQGYLDQMSVLLSSFFKDNPEVAATLEGYLSMGSDRLIEWATSSLLPNLENISGTMVNVGSLMGVLFSGLSVLLKVAKNVLIGFIVAAYMLVGKSGMIARCKKLIYSAFTVKVANRIVSQFRYVHSVFGGFIQGKLLDSLIIGLLCFVGTALMKMPYAVVISVIVGVTNVIPFFGPFIGAIPCACLILLISPLKCVYFCLFILALQQFDGNILGPKILGNSTGLSAFYVLVAILLFGGLFGFVGMIIGVPLFAVLYSLVDGLVNWRLEKRHMSTNTLDYFHLESVKRSGDHYWYEKQDDPTEKG